MPDQAGMREETLFTCPACGSHTWGTSFAGGTTLAHGTGHCNGYTPNGPCKFTWRRVDDAKVMRGTGRFTVPRSVTGVVVR